MKKEKKHEEIHLEDESTGIALARARNYKCRSGGLSMHAPAEDREPSSFSLYRGITQVPFSP